MRLQLTRVRIIEFGQFYYREIFVKVFYLEQLKKIIYQMFRSGHFAFYFTHTYRIGVLVRVFSLLLTSLK